MEKRRGHVRNPSNWSTTSAVRKRTTTYNEKRDYHSTLQKFGEIQDVNGNISTQYAENFNFPQIFHLFS